MAIADDISTALNGDIRWTGGASTYYSVLEFHRYLGALSDDEAGSGDDLHDITSSTASDRSTDAIIDLLDHAADGGPTYNIDDTLAEHLYGGSITQRGGDDVYSGLRVVGTVEAGTEVMVIQDDKVLASFWGTGINADAGNLVISRMLIKSREGGADIDGQKVLLMVKELGDTYQEFPVTLGTAEQVGAVSSLDDIFNNTVDATIAGWTTITVTEGFQELNIDGTGAAGQEFYQQWDKGSQSINDTYERSKWIQQRAHTADSCADTGSDFVVDNATILGQGQEFTATAATEKLVEVRFQLKIGAGTPTGTLVAELYDSDDVATGAPTGAVLATSEPVLTSRLSSTYQEFIFRFNDNVTLTASQAYFCVIRNAAGDGSNYAHVRGLATTGTHAGNRAEDTGTWAGVANDDLWFVVKSSPVIHSRPGELWRGITHEIVYDTESGTGFVEDEIIFWGTQVTYDTLVGGPFTVGEYVTFDNAGTLVNAGKVLKNSGTVLWVALEDISGSTLADGYAITGLSSGATAAINVTITDQNRAGGEGVLYALDDNGTTGDLYIQLISGSAPVDNLPLEGRTSATTALVNVTVTSRPITATAIGQSTGSNLIGAYGVGFDPTDVGASDLFRSLDNASRQPPNNVTVTVTGLVSGEDRILIGPDVGGLLDKDQLILNTSLLGATETAIVTTVAIPTDTPKDGTTTNSRLRVQLDTGVYRRQAYTSYTGSTFTIPSTDYSGANNATAPRNIFVAYIDVLADASSESFTSVYLADRALRLRVRDGGGTPIKPIDNPITLGSSSFSTAITRQTDA